MKTMTARFPGKCADPKPVRAPVPYPTNCWIDRGRPVIRTDFSNPED
jgi:hypothetical protein